MPYSITQLKSDIEPSLHGTTLDEVPNIDNVIYRAARQLLLDVDPQETIRTVPLANTLFQDVFQYELPTDLKGNKVIDIKPQVNRPINSVFTQTFSRNFDIGKYWNVSSPNFTIDFNQMVKSLFANVNIMAPLIITNADNTTDNGTWTATAPATNITNNNINYVNGNGSIQFNLSSGSNPQTGYIENSTLDAVDLTEYLNQGTLFAWVFLPTASDFTSVNLRWGSDTSNYYSKSATTNQSGNAFVDGWNLLAFTWLGSTTTGSPDVTSINTLRVSFTYNGTAQTAVLVNGITCQLGTIYDIQYYSKFLFRDSITGAFQETITDDSNLINLDTESYNLLLECVLMFLAQQLQGVDGQFDYTVAKTNYRDSLARYKAMYKSQVSKPQQAYYNRTTNNFRKWFGRGGRA